MLEHIFYPTNYGATSLISNLLVVTDVWNDDWPPAPLQVRVYVVALVGPTVFEPLVPTEPTPLSIEHELERMQFQEREDFCGSIIFEGEAEKVQRGG